MNRALGHLCGTYRLNIHSTYRLNRARRNSEDGEMTLPSRHKIGNSNLGSLRSSTLPLSHGGSPQNCVFGVDGEETFVSFKPPRPGNEPRALA